MLPNPPASGPASERRVVVLVPHRAPPVVFTATLPQLVLQTQAVMSDTLRLPTLPFHARKLDFERAWESLCVDLLHARHHASIDDAVAAYQYEVPGLPVNVRSAILAALARLRRGTSP